MRTRFSIFAAAVLIACTLPAFADSIIVDGVTHDDVVIRESDARYYVQDPTDGSVFMVSKDSVEPEDVIIDANDENRNQLHQAWRLESGLGEKTTYEWRLKSELKATGYSDAAITNTPNAGPTDRSPIIISREAAVSDGRVRNIKLDDVPLSAALDAVLRPLGLDYRVEDDYIYVSSPERLRTEPHERIETRVYSYTPLGDTLPKIVVQNQGGYGAAASGGGAGGFGGGGGAGGGGFGGGGAGGGGFGGGGAGGGGFGGGGAGGGGFGGGGAGGGGGGQFTNISQLFGTIDDTLVGEPPAQIGLGIIGSGRGF
jgi:hypothetical protein